VARVQHVPAEAEPGQHAGPVVLDEHVRARDELREDRAVAVGGEVERDALLAAVQRHEVGGLAVDERTDLARVVAAPAARPDHARAEPASTSVQWPRQHAGRVDVTPEGRCAASAAGSCGRHRSSRMADSRAPPPGTIL
jgi:hypothetical protein